MCDVWTVTTTTANKSDALTLARRAVEGKLAAGAEVVGPFSTVFWHLGELGEGEEYRLLLKTSADARDRLMVALRAWHPWDNPEITATLVDVASADYRAWIERTTGSQEPGA